MRAVFKLIGVIYKQNHRRYFTTLKDSRITWFASHHHFFPFLLLCCFNALEPEKKSTTFLFSSGFSLWIPDTSILLHKSKVVLVKTWKGKTEIISFSPYCSINWIHAFINYLHYLSAIDSITSSQWALIDSEQWYI